MTLREQYKNETGNEWDDYCSLGDYFNKQYSQWLEQIVYRTKAVIQNNKPKNNIHKWFKCPNCKKVYELDL